MKTILCAVMAACCVVTLRADELPAPMRVWPTPQEVSLKGGDFPTPAEIAVAPAEGFDAAAREALAKRFRLAKEAPFTLTWKVEAKLPAEGYTLTLGESGATLAASDDRGFFYGAQTLRQLLAGDRYTGVTIRDWPDVAFRGTVEGFYGLPWSFESRVSQFRFYGEVKLNTYIYGPKDDPFHGFSNRWRDPYPAEKAKEIAALVKEAQANKVNFVWAVHPGRDIHWKDDSDIKACIKKFEMMYDLGVRSFAVFFDDIGGEGARAEKQVELLNAVNREFVRKKGDVTPLIMCPTDYNASWAGPRYLPTLGKGLDPDIRVMWTGDSVCCPITKGTVETFKKRVGRKPFIWWNWPVNDYCKSRLLLGRCYGNDPSNGPDYSGFVSNPMDKPEASKIALFGVAAYAWNPDAFDSNLSWQDGIRRLFPHVAGAVQVLANHNSAPAGHGFTREESVAIAPVAKRVTQALDAGKAPAKEDVDAMTAELAKVRQSGQDIVEKCKNPLFMNEIRDWAYLFGRLGEVGVTLNAALEGNGAAEDALAALLAYRAEQAALSKLNGQKPFQQGAAIEVGSQVLTPYVNRIGAALYDRLWRETSGKPAPKGEAKLYEFITNAEALKNLRVSRKGQFVQLPRIMEPKTLAPGDWIGIRLPAGVTATWVHFILESADAPKQGRIQVSTDGGKTWSERATVVRGNGQEGEMEIRHINAKDGIDAARYINVSDKPVTITLRQFKVDVPKDAQANVPAAMTDGVLDNGYTLAPGQSVRVALAVPVTEKNTKVLASGKVSVTLEADGVTLTAGDKPVIVHEIIH